jgi:hypothetical protein
MGHCIISYRDMSGQFHDGGLDLLCGFLWNYAKQKDASESAREVLEYWQSCWFGCGVTGIDPDEQLRAEALKDEIQALTRQFIDDFGRYEEERLPAWLLRDLVGDKEINSRGIIYKTPVLRNASKLFTMLNGRQIVGQKGPLITLFDAPVSARWYATHSLPDGYLIALLAAANDFSRESFNLLNSIYKGPGLVLLIGSDEHQELTTYNKLRQLDWRIRNECFDPEEVRERLNESLERIQYAALDLKAMLPYLEKLMIS